MDLQDHHLVLALIAFAAVLGLAVGYCIEVLRSSSREADLVAGWEKERAQLNAAVEKQRTFTRTIMEAERKKSAQARGECEQAEARRDSLQAHADVQAKKIASIEVALRATEEQNLALQSDLVRYKANKKREIDVLRSSLHGNVTSTPERPGARTTGTAGGIAESVPVLSKRVGARNAQMGAAPIAERLASRWSGSGDGPRVSREPVSASTAGFASAISDTEIPRLAESELPDTADDSDIIALLDSDEEVVSSG